MTVDERCVAFGDARVDRALAIGEVRDRLLCGVLGVSLRGDSVVFVSDDTPRSRAVVAVVPPSRSLSLSLPHLSSINLSVLF
mmetsp:Transcript_15674/g.49079  ORF Transcript_15674/g.49079 Transcript_15674/m.49079 type:complete len:82 (+) Transcript_15674:1511-1756(+)